MDEDVAKAEIRILAEMIKPEQHPMEQGFYLPVQISLQSTYIYIYIYLSLYISRSVYVGARSDQALAKVLCRKKFRQKPQLCSVHPVLSVGSKWVRGLESTVRKLVSAPLMTRLFSMG